MFAESKAIEAIPGHLLVTMIVAMAITGVMAFVPSPKASLGLPPARAIGVRPVLARGEARLDLEPTPEDPTPDDMLCLDDVCTPIADWFDAPIKPSPELARARLWIGLPKKRNWAIPKKFGKRQRSWAQIFALRMRLRMSTMSPGAVTIVGAVVNIVLAALKLGVGGVVGSASLLADGWHSFGDLVSDVICWIAVKVGARAPTKRHPDGFRKYEHMLTLAIAAILTSGGVAMAWSSGSVLLAAVRRSAAVPTALLTARAALRFTDLAALAVAVASVVSKELLFGVTHAIGLRCRSPSIVANAYHHRSDALSSLIAIVGIAGALLGVPLLDPLAAMAVGLMVTGMGRDVAQESLDALFAGNAPRSDDAAAAELAATPAPAESGGAETVGRVFPSRSLAPRMSLALTSQLPMAALGGTAAGGLHAISGPDHLAALLPLCLGRRWLAAASTGATWGLGHGVGAALVGALGFALRGALNLDALARFSEVAVGVSIIVIGATGLQEAREWRDGLQECAVRYEAASEIVMSEELCEGENTPSPPLTSRMVTRTLLNGILNGVSGTGHVLGVLPALAMPTWAVAAAYLGCFGMGTFVTMALFTGLIGELSSRMGQRVGSAFNQPAAPANLAMASSALALALGAFWTSRALVALGVPATILHVVGRSVPRVV